MTIYVHKDIVIYAVDADSEIKISADGSVEEMLRVKAQDSYWGSLDFSMNIETAEALANGILDQCEYIRTGKGVCK